MGRNLQKHCRHSRGLRKRTGVWRKHERAHLLSRIQRNGTIRRLAWRQTRNILRTLRGRRPDALNLFHEKPQLLIRISPHERKRHKKNIHQALRSHRRILHTPINRLSQNQTKPLPPIIKYAQRNNFPPSQPPNRLQKISRNPFQMKHNIHNCHSCGRRNPVVLNNSFLSNA